MTCDLSPEGWGRRVVDGYKIFEGDRVVGESNYGGDMVRAVIHSIDRKVSYKHVNASRGKVVRAEPIAALYEQGKVHHVGALPELEDQLVAFTPTGYVGDDDSPDRADAVVWALTELMLGGPGYRITL
jgi:phage terminase large subunit-like protein